MFPFSEVVQSGARVRTFSPEIDDEDLVWHRDAEDRIINVIESSGWYLQLEDLLPVLLIKEKNYEIKSGVWHRVIKRKDAGRLRVEIIVNEHEDKDR